MDKLKHYEELFDALDPQSIYDFLLEIGSQGDFPAELMNSNNFVDGCQSHVWIIGFEEQPGHLKFHGTSDSFMVRGAVYLMCDICSDMTLDELAEVNWKTIEPVGKYFSAQRKRGMQAMLNRIRSIAKHYTQN